MKKVHSLKLSKLMKKGRKNYSRLTEQCYCFEVGFLPVLLKTTTKTTTT